MTSSVSRPKVATQPRGHHLADAADQPGAQVLLDAAHGRRRHRGVGGDLELPAVLRVLDPGAGEAQVLPRLHAQEVADRRHPGRAGRRR